MVDYTEILKRATPVCSSCRQGATTCARCGGPLYAGDQVRCDPDEGMPRHMHDDVGGCPQLPDGPATIFVNNATDGLGDEPEKK